MHFNSFPSTTKRNWVGHHNEKGTSWGLLHWFFQEKGCVGVWKWEFFVLSRVETKQGMKQLKDHEVMDPQFLLVLLGNVAFLEGLKGGLHIFYEFILFVTYEFICVSKIWFPILFQCAGTNRHKKELFVMAVRTPCGRTFPGNFSILPSAKKWVFHAIFRLAFLELYGERVCSMNRLVLTDEEDAEHRSFESLIATNEISLYSIFKVWLLVFRMVSDEFC